MMVSQLNLKYLKDMYYTVNRKFICSCRDFSGLLFFLIFSLSGFSQNAGINANGTVPPDPAAGLDVNFTSKGLLIPRLALMGTTSVSPLAAHVAGMVVYNTASTADVTPGFYFNNGTRWVHGLPKANAAGEMQYWDGTSWKSVSSGQPGQLLQLNGSGVPVWVGAGFANLTTAQITGISSTTATSGGNITSDGGSPVTVRGVCWATNPGPTIANSKTINASGTGSFVSSVTGLTTGTVYYLRAYSTNSAGTSYGDLLIFTTP